MRNAFVVVGLLAAGTAAVAQSMDMAAIQKWTNAKVVHYEIKGVYNGPTAIATGKGAPYAQATVSDTLSVSVDIDGRQAVVGTPKFTNGTSSMTGLTSGAHAKCPPPVATGPFELLTVSAVEGGRASLTLKGTTTFPPISVSSQWPATCAQQGLPGATEAVDTVMPLPSPVMLALPANADPKFGITPDRKSFVLKTANWTWTYTPTLVQ